MAATHPHSDWLASEASLPASGQAVTGRSGPAGGFSKPLLLAACAASFIALLTANPILTLAAIWSLVAIVLLLWRQGELPVLLFALGLQWLEVTMTLMQANLRGEPIERMAVFSAGRELGNATWMGCLALVVVSLGIAASRFRRSSATAGQDYHDLAWYLRPGRVFAVFFVLLLFGQVAPALRNMSGGMGQVVVAVAGLRYVALTLLLYRGLVVPGAWRIPALAFVLEVGFGFLGYFSTFKEAFLVLAISAVAAEVRVTRKAIVYGLINLLAVCLLASFWMSIRTEYRRVLDRGTSSQTVQIPVSMRLTALSRAVSAVGPAELGEGFHNGLKRIAYIEFLAAVREYVPSRRPHSDGALWKSAIEHIAKPRLLFPDKPPLVNDSVITNRYTGVGFAGRERGTSVSLGYVAEAYVDFGFPGMLGPLLALGAVLGLIDRGFREFSRSGLLGVAMAVAVFAIAGSFGQGITKVLGATLYRTIIYAAILLFAYRPLIRFLCAGDPPLHLDQDRWLPEEEMVDEGDLPIDLDAPDAAAATPDRTPSPTQRRSMAPVAGTSVAPRRRPS